MPQSVFQPTSTPQLVGNAEEPASKEPAAPPPAAAVEDAAAEEPASEVPVHHISAETDPAAAATGDAEAALAAS